MPGRSRHEPVAAARASRHRRQGLEVHGREAPAGRCPTPGARRAAPGRASVRTKIGSSRDHSTRWSMKSSVPESAQWTSSKTSATVPLPASASKNARHAPNSSAGDTPAGIPSSCEQRCSTQARSGWPGMCSSSSAAIASRVASCVVRLGEARPAADHLAERPERDALAVRRASGRGATRRSRRCRRGTSRAPTRAGSCRCPPGPPARRGGPVAPTPSRGTAP